MEQIDTQATQNASEETEAVASLQAQLADCRAQLEHWQGVATICEMSKREELGELQKQCDQEIQSLQEALRATASQYEGRISMLQSERAQWRRGGASTPIDCKGRSPKGRSDGDPALKEGPRGGGQTDREAGGAGEGPDGEPGELEARGEGLDGEGAESEGGSLLVEGYFSQHCDTSSLSSFSLDTPSLPRRPPPQEDTASLLSTGTLVPEAIYLPPPGHRLITHSDWDALHAQVSELQGELARLREERADLEKELASYTADTQRQVSVLQSQVQTSEALLQDLQQSLSQSQNTVQSRLAELSLSQKKMCTELSRLRGGDKQEEGEEDPLAFLSPNLQGAHCEERLRIEIVNLKEQLETRTEESEVLEVQLSSLKTETDRIQSHNEKLQNELQACRTELAGLRVAMSHLHQDCKAQSNEKSALQQQCLELRSQVISLRSQVDTSQAVQRDFVQLSQSLQVKLELIRQAESMAQVKEILGEGLTGDVTEPAETT
ncbi:rab GTPase-binding effector protein 2 [Anguilla anguilla]|uniref:rab GTPase-binding effector protein 2 n=1 Tax=Anguilla anguilla TaxID=7936 RepID=UPI0015AB0FFF|nr:rab GTPase-binding effector protein 2 [Anguilla anguilla]